MPSNEAMAAAREWFSRIRYARDPTVLLAEIIDRHMSPKPDVATSYGDFKEKFLKCDQPPAQFDPECGPDCCGVCRSCRAAAHITALESQNRDLVNQLEAAEGDGEGAGEVGRLGTGSVGASDDR